MPARIPRTILATMTATLLLGAPLIASPAQDAPSSNQGQDEDRPRRGAGQDRGQNRGQNRAQNRGNRQVDPARMAARMMQSDTDGDGRISRAEIGEGRFAEMFDQTDANGDGYITEKEITIFLTSRRPGGSGQPGPRRARPSTPGAEEAKPMDPKAAFDKGMEESGRALRGLRRTPFDATSFERDLSSIIRVQDGLLAARLHVEAVPMSDAAKEKFGTDQKAYVRSFQTHMAKSLIPSFQLELAILEGDSAKAKELTTALVSDRNGSHDLFEN